MSYFLVGPPTLHWKTENRDKECRTYLDSMLRHFGNLSEGRFYPVENLSLCYIKSFCQKHSIPTFIINGIALFHGSLEETLDAIKRAARHHGQPLLIGFNGANIVFHENIFLIREVKKIWPKTKTILGQDFSALNYERILTDYPEVDFVCVGDGELTSKELYNALAANKSDFSNIPGLAWRSEINVISLNKPEYLNLDELPWPSRDDVGVANYHGFGVGVSTSRGCRNRCAFCTTGQLSGKDGIKKPLRLRNIDDVLNEIEYLYRDYNVRHFVFNDELFFGKDIESKQRAEIFAEKLIKRSLDLFFMFDMRIDSVDVPLLKLLKTAGLKQVFIGLESASEKQLKRLNKYYPKELNISETLNKLSELDIKFVPGMINFDPEVTVDDLEINFKMLVNTSLQRWFLFLSKVRPVPGTFLYNYYLEKGFLEDLWPVPSFKFQNPKIKTFYDELIKEADKPGITWEDMCKAYLRLLEQAK
ncbi:MAG: B12-binding domain-containing radical SAM protein [Candidatus Riflebacteria bacterium]|nr:B12-binding domain-containing radical SAM protein [Candidatus Riflebacteria bacterium]